MADAPEPEGANPAGAAAEAEGGAGGGAEPGSVINLMELSAEELQKLKQVLEGELKKYHNDTVQLRYVQTKMEEAGNCVKSLSADKKELLLPLTSSLYVKGEVEDVDHVLIDIGTGYYVEKTKEDAMDYFKRKVEYLTTEIENIQKRYGEVTAVGRVVAEVLESKVDAEIEMLSKGRGQPPRKQNQ